MCFPFPPRPAVLFTMTTAPGDQPHPTHLLPSPSTSVLTLDTWQVFLWTPREPQHKGNRDAVYLCPMSCPGSQLLPLKLLSELINWTPWVGVQVVLALVVAIWNLTQVSSKRSGHRRKPVGFFLLSRIILFGNCGCSSEVNNEIITRYIRFTLYWRYEQGDLCHLVCQSIKNH